MAFFGLYMLIQHLATNVETLKRDLKSPFFFEKPPPWTLRLGSSLTRKDLLAKGWHSTNEISGPVFFWAPKKKGAAISIVKAISMSFTMIFLIFCWQFRQFWNLMLQIVHQQDSEPPGSPTTILYMLAFEPPSLIVRVYHHPKGTT